MIEVWVVAIVALLMLNIAATTGVVQDQTSQGSQARFQIILIWLLPLAGALLTFLFRRIQEAQRRCR